MAGRTSSDIPCFTCDIVTEYVNLANKFTQDLSSVLIGPIWVLFLAICGIWIVWHGIKMVIGQGDPGAIAKEFVYVFIAAMLVGGQGVGLVNQTYEASLSVMGSAAAVAISVAGDIKQSPDGINGMTELVRTAEEGVMKVFGLAESMAQQTDWTNLMPLIYAGLLILPYLLLLIVYFSQVVVSIFRVMMLSALSPILMMGFGFGWGRGMAQAGLRTLAGAFMVLFGSTIALALCLYGVKAMNIADPAMGSSIQDTLSITNPQLLLTLALGWMGTAFMAEATAMANSIAGSSLTNQAASIITAGAVATGMSIFKAGSNKKNLGRAGSAAGLMMDSVLHPRQAVGAMSDTAKSAMDRLKTPRFDRGKGPSE
ncbi:MAG: type IV secretion system protein [Rhodospirillum sp.]|nr:type IV secretion system protein [Rhodospirillum sp.]